MTTRTDSSSVSSVAREQVSSLFKEAKALYAPGGGYMKGLESQLARGSERAVASGVQNLASAGLAGTSMVGGLGLQYEEDVATPARAGANTQRLGALSNLLQAEAGATANMATRYSTSPAIYTGGGGGVPSQAPRSTSRPKTATATATAAKLPTLSAFPNLSGGAKKEPTGYKGVWFGKAFYDRQKAAAKKTQPKSSGSFYGDFQKASQKPLKGLDPYGISSLF